MGHEDRGLDPTGRADRAGRDRGLGRRLFEGAEAAVSAEAEFILLSTATKNWRAILHFYLEELGMEFWSARLYKKLRGGGEAPSDGGREAAI